MLGVQTWLIGIDGGVLTFRPEIFCRSSMFLPFVFTARFLPFMRNLVGMHEGSPEKYNGPR